jgi:hypothetical protein
MAATLGGRRSLEASVALACFSVRTSSVPIRILGEISNRVPPETCPTSVQEMKVPGLLSPAHGAGEQAFSFPPPEAYRCSADFESAEHPIRSDTFSANKEVAIDFT